MGVLTKKAIDLLSRAQKIYSEVNWLEYSYFLEVFPLDKQYQILLNLDFYVGLDNGSTFNGQLALVPQRMRVLAGADRLTLSWDGEGKKPHLVTISKEILNKVVFITERSVEDIESTGQKVIDTGAAADSDLLGNLIQQMSAAYFTGRQA